jgi:endonuclease/exonuclease/phosphatase family metal-dependent hydrolase
MRKGLTLAIAILATAVLEYGDAVLAKEQDKKTVTVANINVFHGIPCAATGGNTQCHLAERIDLLFEHLAAIGCPDIVTLQEVLDLQSGPILSLIGLVTIPEDRQEALTSVLRLIKAKLEPFARVCGFQYEFLYAADLIGPLQGPFLQGIDEELILSRYPIQEHEVRLLHSTFFVPGIKNRARQFFARHVLFARIAHPVGPIDVFTTHLAASEDLGENPCDSHVSFPAVDIAFDVPCPAECDPRMTIRECEAHQVANFVKQHHHGPLPAFITGDFNAEPGSNEYIELTDRRGWLDSHLEAGNQECDGDLLPEKRGGCTAGRKTLQDAIVGDVDRRIDYIFVVPSAPELECKIQAKGTGLFADEPNPTNPACVSDLLPTEPANAPLCWASDHNGTRAKLSCERSADYDLGLTSW